jgi:hypothetical protein
MISLPFACNFSGLAFLLLFGLSCKIEKPRASPSRQDLRTNLIRSFFATPLKNKGVFSGFWTIDPKEFSNLIESTYLKDYKPLPNEAPVDKVRATVKDSRFFLRIDGLFCDELFFIDGGEFTASPGRLRQLEKTHDRIAYEVIFGRFDSAGKRIDEGAILTAFFKPRKILLEFPDRKFSFYPETADAQSLAEKYGKPAFATGLAEY